MKDNEIEELLAALYAAYSQLDFDHFDETARAYLA
jgi:hypothetical protein